MRSIVSLFATLAWIGSAAAEHELPQLPYGYTALQPMISAQTLRVHHDKHHAKYVDTTNSLIAGTNLESQSLEEIIKSSFKKDQGLFNNAAQSWNHAFYWKCMKRNGGGQSKSKKLLELIVASFGSFDDFKKEFAAAGNTAFGSGWAWLVYNSKTKKLLVTKTIGADNPMTTASQHPILTMDVWEHAYYLDYQNMRPTYVDAFLNKLVNWDFVQENLLQAMPGQDEL